MARSDVNAWFRLNIRKANPSVDVGRSVGAAVVVAVVDVVVGVVVAVAVLVVVVSVGVVVTFDVWQNCLLNNIFPQKHMSHDYIRI